MQKKFSAHTDSITQSALSKLSDPLKSPENAVVDLTSQGFPLTYLVPLNNYLFQQSSALQRSIGTSGYIPLHTHLVLKNPYYPLQLENNQVAFVFKVFNKRFLS